jgi:glucose/arabinose dehydrogenase
MGRERTRRRYLEAVGGAFAVTSVAGCVGGASEDLDAEATADRTTETTGRTTGATAEYPYDVSVRHDGATGTDEGWEPPTAPPGEYGAEVLAENLAIPWDLSVAPSGDLFLTERVGRIRSYDGSEWRTVVEPPDMIDTAALAPGTETRSWLIEGGEGGLLGVATHPTYPDPPLVYGYYTAETDEGRRNRVVAFDVTGDAEPLGIVDGIPASAYHNGGRLAFGPSNYLWVTAGDADPRTENQSRTRDPASLAGTVLRVAPNGDPAGSPGGDPRVYTYGHRNPQGIAWTPDGTTLVTEHGPGGGDEVSVLRKGSNYGWPDVRAGDGYGSYAAADHAAPVVSAPDWAPSGAVFYTGDELPGLQNRLLIGSLVGQQVVALTLTRGRLDDGHGRRHDETWLDDTYRAASAAILDDAFGRIRHLEQGPDGGLYALTSNRDGRAGEGFPTDRDDRLLRIRPT